MPKRARETEETQDSAWIGRAAMLTPAAARGKRLPEAIVMKILRVTRGAGASKVLLEYDLNGVKKQYTDGFLSGTPLAERFVAVAAAVRMDSERFMAVWSFQGAAPYAAPAECPRERALGEVLPALQLRTNVELPISIDKSNARRTAAAVLACSIQPFVLDDVFRVSCGEESFLTKSEDVRAEAMGRRCRDAWMESVFCGDSPAREESARRVGRCLLHPWQAAVVARIMRLAGRPGSAPEKMIADFTCAVDGQAPARVECFVPHRAAVLHAGTGMGKTFVAAALCLDRIAYCIALPNSLRQWVREAAKIGACAVWAESSESLWRHVAALRESSPRAGLIILSHTLLRSHNFWQLALPQSDLAIVDETHKARDELPQCVFRLVQKFRDVFTLSLTASVESNEGRTDSAVARVLGLDPRALPGAVITVPACANAAAAGGQCLHLRRAGQGRR